MGAAGSDDELAVAACKQRPDGASSLLARRPPRAIRVQMIYLFHRGDPTAKHNAGAPKTAGRPVGGPGRCAGTPLSPSLHLAHHGKADSIKRSSLWAFSSASSCVLLSPAAGSQLRESCGCVLRWSACYSACCCFGTVAGLENHAGCVRAELRLALPSAEHGLFHLAAERSLSDMSKSVQTLECTIVPPMWLPNLLRCPARH